MCLPPRTAAALRPPRISPAPLKAAGSAQIPMPRQLETRSAPVAKTPPGGTRRCMQFGGASCRGVADAARSVAEGTLSTLRHSTARSSHCVGAPTTGSISAVTKPSVDDPPFGEQHSVWFRVVISTAMSKTAPLAQLAKCRLRPLCFVH